MAETGQASVLRWWALERGDIDATVAQVGFNVAQMIIPAFLLVPVGIAMGFSVGHLLPGFALGFFVGSMGLTALAVGLAKREGRTNVTAHVYINNVPGIIAYTLSIMLPVYLQTRDQELAWRVGAAAVVWTGIIKLVAAPLAGTIRKYIPKPAMMTVFGAAMYTYLAMVLLQRIFDQPLVGIVALAIVAVSRSWPMFRSRSGGFLPSSSPGSFRSPSDCPSATFIPPGAVFPCSFPSCGLRACCRRWASRFPIFP